MAGWTNENYRSNLPALQNRYWEQSYIIIVTKSTHKHIW
jgi:hypothetical protein